MRIMNTELYDALVDAGASEKKARAAASAYGDPSRIATKDDLSLLKSDLNLLRWMAGFNLALTTTILLTLILK